MRLSAIAVICLSAALSACATSGGTGSSATSSASRSNAPRITAQEIADANMPTAYDVVEKLRRQWLRRSGMGADVLVYQDEQQVGGAGALRDMPATTVAELQFVAYEDAVRRWGAGIKGAVIVVIPRR